jgi:hypothetical protein
MYALPAQLACVLCACRQEGPTAGGSQQVGSPREDHLEGQYYRTIRLRVAARARAAKTPPEGPD